MRRSYIGRTILASIFILCILFALTHRPQLYGDGNEYLQMIISFVNHGSAHLLPYDIEIRNQLHASAIDPYNGYFKDLDGKYYSFHFWFYSLLCVPAYVLLKFFDLNVLKAFQLTNVLMLFVLIFMIYRSSIERNRKIWLYFGLVNPIWLYVQWSNSEVFSFVFLYMGLLKFLEKKAVPAVILTAIASLQNPGIALITAIIGFVEFIMVLRERKITKRFVGIVLGSSIVIFPYLWYWAHYRVFSLIGETYTTSMSTEKLVSLFLDPNFGMLIYIPMAFVILAFLLVKKDYLAVVSLGMLILIGLICTVQINWNSGNIYMNRYAVWMIPIAIYGCINISNRLRFKVWAISSLIINGLILLICIGYYSSYSHTQFTPLAKLVIASVPGLYNPPVEVLAERAIDKEVYLPSKDRLPIIFYQGETKRKELDMDEQGTYHYRNFAPHVSFKPLAVFKPIPAKEDINLNPMSISFTSGFYQLEDWQGRMARWVKDEAILEFLSSERRSNKTISISLGSFYKPNHAEIFFNGTKVYDGIISNEEIRISFNQVLKEKNSLIIKSKDKVVKVSELDSYKGSSDNRILAFYTTDLQIS
ncbi:hypothetical protein VE23_15015 [Paenibacillus sp. D9]|uniref:hypothetical protein n=1 Tax=Paenibacillus sp. D9 TaxID=665792 RepID=UPI00061EFA53|nr:hypothetical protein [Paenibacillus sp. D9]KKC48117.1 hypothetical protein VE23_15015 [Paenibacillus sp. D9]